MPTVGEHGAGTMVKLPNGRYRIAVTMADGRRVWRRARTEREAERIRKQLVEARELDLDPTRQTLADYLRSWIEGLRDARNQRVRPRTLEHYEMIVERHIIPALGHLKLSRVTGRKVQAWLDADPAAPRTVRHHHAVLRRALNIAVRQRLLAYNPAASVELPDADDDRSDPLTIEEARTLLAATAADRLGVLWRLAIVTGLRQGELLGLGWDDIEGDRVTVRAQLQRIGGAWVRTAPKAARSVAVVTIDADTAMALDAHRRRMAAERTPLWRYHGLVFTTPTGNPYHGSDVVKAFHLACVKAEMEHHPDADGECTAACKSIRPRRFHDLRHTSATTMRAEGVAEDTRMARLGHSTTSMARRYAKASEAQDRDAAERLGRALSG